MTETELKPCPLCQSIELHKSFVRDGQEIRCGGCGLALVRHHGPNNDTNARLIKAWNTRASDERVEALQTGD